LITESNLEDESGDVPGDITPKESDPHEPTTRGMSVSNPPLSHMMTKGVLGLELGHAGTLRLNLP
jgi:hypothetical protein